MSDTSVSPDLTKLSVPQLRAICREKKLTGYSKLPKAGLLQILNSVTSTATQLSDAKAASTTGRPTDSKGKGKAKPRPNLEKDVPNELLSTDAQIYPAQSDTRYNAAQQSVNTSASVTWYTLHIYPQAANSIFYHDCRHYEPREYSFRNAIVICYSSQLFSALRV
ncbi:hypothetical protein QCA50_006995 [Cerrena zonata]|uniref:Rho termination factor N-terminal domain-containing protein n=1 Tax=Cerrena zonata TaxID=2478898 RepID=A0AAW0G9K9_9APHY